MSLNSNSLQELGMICMLVGKRVVLRQSCLSGLSKDFEVVRVGIVRQRVQSVPGPPEYSRKPILLPDSLEKGLKEYSLSLKIRIALAALVRRYGSSIKRSVSYLRENNFLVELL